MHYTYLSTEELSERIKYDPRTIRECLKDSVLLEGIHYLRPFGRRKILYIWERIEKDMFRSALSPVSERGGPESDGPESERKEHA